MQLGKDSKGQKYKKCKEFPTRIDSLPRIVKVACGSNYALALSDKGDLYAWGGNHRGQLGIGYNLTPIRTPEKVTHNIGRVSDIAALHSKNISVAVSESGCVYVWGQCRSQSFNTPTLALFSNVHDVFAYYVSPSVIPRRAHKDKESNIHERQSNALNDEATNDLTIERENKPIFMHKTILDRYCPYLKIMFDWWGPNQSEFDDPFSDNVIEALCNYWYTGVVELPPAEAFELLKLADFLHDNNLKQRCTQLIKKTISVANVMSVYVTAIEKGAQELMKFCFDFALDHMRETMRDFGNLRPDLVDLFLVEAAKAGAFE